MFLQVMADDNDIEGMIWEGSAGNIFDMYANGPVQYPRFQLTGRPIGFRVWMGISGGVDQPILMSVITN